MMKLCDEYLGMGDAEVFLLLVPAIFTTALVIVTELF